MVPQPPKPVFRDPETGRETFENTGFPVEAQRRDDENRALYEKPDGGTSIHPSSDDGETPYKPIMDQKVAPAPDVERKLFWDADGEMTTVDTGDPVMDFGSMRTTMNVVAKQKDDDGNRLPTVADPKNPVGPWTERDLTMAEVKALQTIYNGGTIGGESFEGALNRWAAAHNLHKSPATADAAGD